MQSKGSDFASIFLRHSLPLFIAILIFAFAMIAITNAFVSGGVYNQANQTLYQASVYYDSIVGEISALNLVFSTNNDAVRSLRMVADGMSADYDTYKEIRLITSFLTAMVSSQRYINAIYIFIPEQEFLVSDSGLVSLSFVPERSWFESYAPSSLGSTRTEVIADGNQIRISQSIMNTVGKYAGVIAIDLDTGRLRESFSEYFRGSDMYLSVCNLEGDVLFSTLDGISQDSLEHFFYVSENNGLVYNLYIDKSEINTLLGLMILLIVLLSFVIILIGLFISYRTDKEEREFIDVLVDALEAKESKAAEAGGSFYKNLTVTVLDNFMQNDYLKLQKEVSDYRALQMQINPHFLFNTLDNIYWKTIRLSGSENDASHMLMLLSSLFKASLASGHSDGIPLDQELESARTYIKLQKYRFHDKFSYTERLEIEEHLDLKVPGMMLQPLLENAISHGMVEGRALVIALTVKCMDNILLIDVYDDGKPLKKEELERLNSSAGQALMKNHSIGLMNVRDRLRIFSRGGSELIVKSDGIRGVTVSISLPL